MPNIKPVSDLRNYAEVLRNIGVGSPVYLTKNGRGRYVIQDMEEYEKKESAMKLVMELEKGRLFGLFYRYATSDAGQGWGTPDGDG